MHIFYKRKQCVNNLMQQHVDAQSSVLGQHTANMSLQVFSSSAVKHTENTLQHILVKERCAERKLATKGMKVGPSLVHSFTDLFALLHTSVLTAFYFMLQLSELVKS